MFEIAGAKLKKWPVKNFQAAERSGLKHFGGRFGCFFELLVSFFVLELKTSRGHFVLQRCLPPNKVFRSQWVPLRIRITTNLGRIAANSNRQKACCGETVVQNKKMDNIIALN